VRRLAATIVDGFKDIVGLSAQGADRVHLSYTREVRAQLIQVDHLSLDLGSLPQGRYRLAIVITDIPSGRSATRERDIHVSG